MNTMRFSSMVLFLLMTISWNSYSQSVQTGPVSIGKSGKDNPAWFSAGYENYQPDSVFVEKIKKAGEGYSFLIFAGLWCSDTKKILPPFFKITNEANIPEDRIQVYLVDNNKRSKERLEKKYKIKFVPTFIVFRNGKEVAKIVERPKKSIEEDLAEIIK